MIIYTTVTILLLFHCKCIHILCLLYFFPGESIPPKATLHFEVELVNIKDGPKIENIFSQIDTNKDKLLSPDEVRIAQ